MEQIRCKFGDSTSNMWRVIMRTKYSLRTDRWTDEQTQATTIPLRPERPMGKNDPIAKKIYIDWTQGLKYDHQISRWLWPWPWVFRVSYGICYTSAKNGQITTKLKANILIEPNASNVAIGFDLEHDLQRWGDRGDFRCRRAVDSASLYRPHATPPLQEILSHLG